MNSSAEVTVRVKSPRQLDRIKSTVVGQTYELSLTKSYVSSWGLPQAVRELIQNALDSESPFLYEFISEADTWTLVLKSEHSTLAPSTLLLGSTSKGGSQDSIGSFGEGYKLALLVLTRLGIDVEMLNGDHLWHPRFRFSRIYNEELLVVDESFLLEKGNKGLTFYIHGLSMEDKQAIVDSCLYMQDHIGAIKQTKYGDILLERKGKLYVGHLYICDTELKYGYNIRPRYLKLERDRQTVDGWDLQTLTTQIWLEIDDPSVVAQMIADEVPDVAHTHMGVPELIKEECFRIFMARHPGALIASSAEEARRKIKEGLIETKYVGGGMYYAVESSSSYRGYVSAVPRVPPASPQSILQTFFNSFREHISDKAAEAFMEVIKQSGDWKIRHGD